MNDSLVTPPRWVLPLLLALYAALTLALILRVDVGHAPDENEHLEFVAHLATTGHLPVFVPRGGNGPGFEFHQPPLYYAACAPVWKVAGALGCRLVSLACGLIVLACAWSACRMLFPTSGDLAILTGGLVALSPLHQGVGAAANNDAMAGALAALLFWFVARVSTRPPQRFDALWLGLLAGLAVLSKTTALVLVPVALSGAWLFAVSPDASPAARLKSVMTTGVVALLVCGWWLWRNQNLYGDPLALGAISARFEDIGSRTWKFFASGVDLPTYLRALGLILLCTTWGFFGGPNTALEMLRPFASGPPPFLALLPPLPAFVLALAMLWCAIASALALIGLLRAMRERDQWPNAARRALAWWLVGALLVWVAWGRFNLIQFQAQARYFHPALLPLALGFALGWRAMWRRALWPASLLLALTLLGLTLANVLGWRTLV